MYAIRSYYAKFEEYDNCLFFVVKTLRYGQENLKVVITSYSIHYTKLYDVLTKDRAGANYVLTGEILSIDLPTVSWNTNSDASYNFV